MITNLTQEQFISLPSLSLHYLCDECGEKGDSWALIRDKKDYTFIDGKYAPQDLYTALYLCGVCHHHMSCSYRSMERREEAFEQEMKREKYL